MRWLIYYCFSSIWCVSKLPSIISEYCCWGQHKKMVSLKRRSKMLSFPSVCDIFFKEILEYRTAVLKLYFWITRTWYVKMRYEYLDVPDMFKTNNVEKVQITLTRFWTIVNIIIVKSNLDKLDQIKITPSKIVGLTVSLNTFF